MLLWALLAVFVVRILAQPLALVVDAPILPRFEDWQSGALPYGWLLVSQVIMAAGFAYLAAGVWTGRTRPRKGAGVALVGIGGVYFAVMLVRLILGVTMLRDHWWFDRPLPTVVHLALAAFLLEYARYHLRVNRAA